MLDVGAFTSVRTKCQSEARIVQGTIMQLVPVEELLSFDLEHTTPRRVRVQRSVRTHGVKLATIEQAASRRTSKARQGVQYTAAADKLHVDLDCCNLGSSAAPAPLTEAATAPTTTSPASVRSASHASPARAAEPATTTTATTAATSAAKAAPAT